MIESANPHAAGALRGLLDILGVEPAGRIIIRGDDFPAVSPHRLASASAAALAAMGTGVANLWRARGGGAQDIAVDTARAVQALRTYHYSLKNGRRLPGGKGPLQTYHRTADGRWIYIYGHHIFGHFLDRTLDLLNCPHNLAAIDAAIAKWPAQALEDALNARGVPAAFVRSEAEWAAHPQGQWLAQRPVVEIERIGDTAPEPLPPGPRPLAGVRVLDLTHILCGPYIARALAEQSADVLRLSPVDIRDPESVLIDTGWGKRSAYIDFNEPGDLATVRALVAEADVVVQSFRPGAFDRFGLSVADLARLRPGLVVVSVSAYGTGGPWARRGALEALGQAVAGISHAEALDGRPRSVRTGTLNDYLGAYVGAAGALAALLRRHRTGGSHHVKVSLARTSMWVRELGTMPEAAAHMAAPYAEPVEPALMEADTPYGRVTTLRPPLDYSATPSRWDRPTAPLGSGTAEWLPR